MMRRTKHTASQIVEKLKRFEALTGGGKTIAEAVKSMRVTEKIYYRWKKQYGGMDKYDVGRPKELEKENGQLKRLLADQMLDNAILEYGH